jgi:hypothetical protein
MFYMTDEGASPQTEVPLHSTNHYFQAIGASAVERPQRIVLVDLMRSPARSAFRMMSGLGQEEEGIPEPVIGGTAMVALGVGILVVGGFLSYQAGKAMAPSGSKESTWGWIGVPVGLFTGTLGLGIMGIVSNRSK